LRTTLLKRGTAVCVAALLAAPVSGVAQVSSDPHAFPPSPEAALSAGQARGKLSDAETANLRQALAAARSGSRDRYYAAMSQITDPGARKLATWAMVDAFGEGMSFSELDQARLDLLDFPRAARREQLAEKAIGAAPLGPQAIVDWFNGQPPTTAEGAMALAAAYVQLGRQFEARQLIRTTWREKMFEAGVQSTMLARFGSWLTTDDHIARLDSLLMGPQGPAVQAMLPLVPDDNQQLAQARMALRADRSDAMSLAEALPESVRNDRGLAFEKSRWLRLHGRMDEGFALLGLWPQAPAHDDGAQRLYSEARQYFVTALQAQNWLAAYDVMAHRGFPAGERKAEAEFFAGWVALKKLHDPTTAAKHFEGVREAGHTPLTQGRALYWLGRAYEAKGDDTAAQAYYVQGAQHIGAFYGQLAAEKAGFTTITLPTPPVLTAADRASFESRDIVRAIRILQDLGEDSLFRTFVMAYDDTLATPQDFAQLIDLTRNAGEGFTAMMIGRAAAGKGVILPERMYPLTATPKVAGAPDPAFVLAITRQESSFDPNARSPADARGMMMLLPSTARIVARQMGVSYSASRLYDSDYNMQLGTFHLGQLVDTFDGSYLMTAAGYNAGPGRPAKWVGDCGDPRSAATDPVDFIECTPFGETRDYMMRVMENMQVYRARLNGGTGPLTLSADLKRGAAGYASPAAAPEPTLMPASVSLTNADARQPPSGPNIVAMQPIP
jgi:soluble lytic murein transglycosylase